MTTSSAFPIIFDDVSHRFGDRHVLHHISVRLDQPRIGIIGANGSGKSTFARLINGLVHPTSGAVTVDGYDTVRHGSAVRRQVGFVFTDADTQIVMPTVAEDIAFSLRRSALSRAERTARVSETLAQLQLTDLADHPAHTLSGGQKQLLAWASVLVRRPTLIVADEPTTLLDLRNAQLITEFFVRLPQRLIVVTHQLEALAEFDRVITIEAGRIVADGAPDDVISAYRNSFL